MEIPINSKRGESEQKEDNAAEIEATLARTLELIHAERDEWRAFENNIDDLLSQCVDRLRLLIGVIRDDEAGLLSGLSESKRDLVLNDTLGAERLLAQVLKRIAQPQIAGKGRTISFRYLHNALALLEVAVKEASVSAGETGQSISQAQQRSQQASQLQDQISQENNLLNTLESDLRQRPEILEALHTQALFVHRCRSILRGSQQKMLPDLLSTAVQIEETVKGERLESAGDPRFWTSRNDNLDDQLCQLESRQKRRLLPIPSLGWIARRLARLQRQESTQGRILAGLGVSLSIALAFYAVTTSATFLLGTLSAINKTNARMRSFDDYSRLALQVKRLLDNKNQTLDLEADLEVLNNSIDVSVASIKALQDTPGGSPASTQESIKSNQGRGAEDNQAQEEQSLQSQLNMLNQERNQKLRQRALKLDEYNQILSNLSSLETKIASSTILPPSIKVASASPAPAATTALSTEEQAQTPTANQPGSVAIGEVADRWYVSLVDVLASPIQDPAVLRHSRRLALAAFAGALGSIMSILIRLDQMDGNNVKNPFMVGALKPVIGAVFGIVTFMILSTNVIDFMPANFRLHSRPASMAGTSNDSATAAIAVLDPLGELDSQELYKIFLVAFLAGFSERLASDTLRSVDRK